MSEAMLRLKERDEQIFSLEQRLLQIDSDKHDAISQLQASRAREQDANSTVFIHFLQPRFLFFFPLNLLYYL